MTLLMNCIFDQGKVIDAVKIGVLTTVFKNKDSKKDAKECERYKKIPIITKIVEILLRGFNLNRSKAVVLMWSLLDVLVSEFR